QSYLAKLNKFGPKIAFISETNNPYNDSFFGEIPFVCVKIPTGGGKTLVATHILTKLFETTLKNKLDKGIVLWFVPSEAIKTQTLKKLQDKKDFHRQVLDEYFNNKILVLSNEEALRLRKQDIENNGCIIISSLDAFRKEKQKRGGYKVYQEKGELLNFFENVQSKEELQRDKEGTIINSLANVVRMNQPLIVIDEGHRAKTLLSIEFLKDLNPSFIIEFTATPREGSNILVNVHSSELKEAQMIKIPIVLESVAQWQQAVIRGVLRRKELEEIAKKEKTEYLRPITLLQAEQEKESAKKVTVQQLKEFLIKDQKIPEEQIAIKTSKTNELDGINLFSKNCKIRYIITVNALAEGWDCSFAYLLISVANIGSKISVEQIIGRIVRMPNATKKKIEDLNNCYIFASAKNFKEAATQIISGLERNGFSKLDLVNASERKKKYELEVEKAIKEKLLVPYMFFEGEPLTFGDLIGENFELSKQNPEFDFETHYDSDGRVKIDIRGEDEWVLGRQTTLNIAYKDKSFSEKELVQWLDKKIRIAEVDKIDKVKFIEKALSYQLTKHRLAELSVNRFILKEKLEKEIKEKMEHYSKKQFDKLIKERKITLKENEDFPETIIVPEKGTEEFKKCLYKEVGKLNKEEMNLASRLDRENLPNIKFWARNREKKDWYIQGWRKNKFYPDFIAVTKKGTILALEWKGEDRISNEDTKYKLEIGKEWETLGKDKTKFYLVHNDNIDDVLKEIEQIN
ncbi:MAG: DEAD/DEAH box helicase family protein, partial [Candidatus Diapherotrites archaeon]|nr:DEAD/DEAH box helicase family protein [Candidatus Diapherotrites archaeon]